MEADKIFKVIRITANTHAWHGTGVLNVLYKLAHPHNNLMG
jgi:hypothetical protein